MRGKKLQLWELGARSLNSSPRLTLKTYTLKTWPQEKLRAIDLLQDPIDPKELVSSLRTKASYFDVVIPRPTGVNLVAGLPPQDPSNQALEHRPSRPRLKTWPWPTLVMTTFRGWWIDNKPLFPLLNTLHHSMGFYMTEYSSPMLPTHLWGNPLGYKFKPFQYKFCLVYIYIL